MEKISPFVGKDETIGPVVRIGPFVGIGLFGGTGPVVSLTYINTNTSLLPVFGVTVSVKFHLMFVHIILVWFGVLGDHLVWVAG